MAASKGVYGESARRVDADRRTGILENAGADGSVSTTCRHGRTANHEQHAHVVVDKIASVTQACGLSHEMRIAPEIPCEEGLVLVVEILNNKANYNTLELTSGRMAKVVRGDIVVGALGHRKALFGYSGHIPDDAPARRRDSNAEHRRRARNMRFGDARQGQALRLQGVGHRADVSLFWASASAFPPRSGYKALHYDAPLDARGVPVVALAGTCMEAGKTAAASAIIARMRHRGLIVDAFKATGVSLRRDIMAFEDSGARRTMLFTDLGIVTTTAKCGPALTRTMLTEMAPASRMRSCSNWATDCWEPTAWSPSCASPTSKQALTAVVLSANDPVAAWGGVKLLRERFGIEPCAVTGPATDNQVGVEIIREQMQVEAFNASALRRISAITSSRLARTAQRARFQGGRRMNATDSGGHSRRHRLRRRRTAAPARGHPQHERRGDAVGQPAGRAVAAAFAHLRDAYPELKFSAPRTSKPCFAATGDRAVLRRTARRIGGPSSIGCCAPPSRPARACIAWIFPRTFATPARRRTRRCTSILMAPRENPRVHLRRARTSTAFAHTACRASGLFRHRDAVGERTVAGSWAHRCAAVRHRHHRQHRLGPQAGRGHASSARHSDLYTYGALESPARAGDHRLREAGDGHRGGVQLRAALRALCARHSRHRAGEPEEAAEQRTGWRRCALLQGLPVRAGADGAPRVKDVADQQLFELERGDQRQDHRRDVGARQPEQGRRRRRHSVDESLLGFPETAGLTAPAPGWT
jgi:hypothetical protein